MKNVQAEERPHQCAEYIGKAARILMRLKRLDMNAMMRMSNAYLWIGSRAYYLFIHSSNSLSIKLLIVRLFLMQTFSIIN